MYVTNYCVSNWFRLHLWLKSLSRVQLFRSVLRRLIASLQGKHDLTGGCRCGMNGQRCMPFCNNCHWRDLWNHHSCGMVVLNCLQSPLNNQVSDSSFSQQLRQIYTWHSLSSLASSTNRNLNFSRGFQRLGIVLAAEASVDNYRG